MKNQQLPDSGQQLKRYRRERRLTLEQLALKAELSASYISKIERGAVSPSAEAIQKLSYALGLTASEFVLAPEERLKEEGTAPAPRQSAVFPAEARSLIYEFGSVLTFESILDENPHFKVNVLTFPKRSDDAMRSLHSHDEFGIVSKGVLELTLGDGRVLTVHEGEGVMIRSGMSHSSRCLSEDGCVSYWIEILD